MISCNPTDHDSSVVSDDHDFEDIDSDFAYSRRTELKKFLVEVFDEEFRSLIKMTIVSRWKNVEKNMHDVIHRRSEDDQWYVGLKHKFDDESSWSLQSMLTENVTKIDLTTEHIRTRVRTRVLKTTTVN